MADNYWLNSIVDEIEQRHPDGEVLVESGASPSGIYHFGHLREVITCDAILLELRRRGRQARHVHFVDDLDALRKIPVNIPDEYEKYLGIPLCDVPAPDGSDRSYADYFVQDLIDTCKVLGIEVEFIRSHEKYRTGFFVPAIERAIERADQVRKTLEEVSGHKLDENWSPIQVLEGEYLKSRKFVAIDTNSKTIQFEEREGGTGTVAYDKGEVKLDWRIDWPARWWLLPVHAEPAGRDHSTRGGSFDTGLAILKDVFDTEGLVAVPYDFVNLAGDPKKMSASRGTGIQAKEIAKVLPPEVVRFFMLRYPPSKRLYFDQVDGMTRLVDEFAELISKERSEAEQQLLSLCTQPLGDKVVVSPVPFSHLVESYQAALKDPEATLNVLRRTEYKDDIDANQEIIKHELEFIDAWLEHWAPEDVKFSLQDTVDVSSLSSAQKSYLAELASKVESAPKEADGEWFHKAIYDFKDSSGLEPKQLFTTLYQVILGKDSGPRAGWFLSMLDRDWLIKRLREAGS